MSKLIFKLYLILGISAIYSQTYEDALRYNQFYHEGSSRFNSMGGAFGALGGDLSSININPAGSSIFLKSELGFTLNFKNQEIKNWWVFRARSYPWWIFNIETKWIKRNKNFCRFRKWIK